MAGPFPTYLGNQRNTAIPVVPTHHDQVGTGAAAVYDLGTITLSAANIAAGVVNAYVYYLYANPDPTAGASNTIYVFQFQFRTAAHANVGGATAFYLDTAVGNPNPLVKVAFYPSYPGHLQLTIPATSAEIVFQANAAVVVGAPSNRTGAGWGIDITNTGVPGDIGGGGIVAQSTASPNAF